MTDVPDLTRYNNRKLIISTSITLVSRILGSSMLPGGYAFRFIGLIPSIIIMIVNIVAYILFNKCVVDSIYYTNSRSYDDLVKRLLNKKMALLFNASIMLDSYGTLVGYQIVAARSIIDIIRKYTSVTMSYQNLKFIGIGAMAVLFCYPLSLLKSMKALGKISPFSVGLITLLVLTINFYFIKSFANGGSMCTFEDFGKAPVVLQNDYMSFSDMGLIDQVLSYMKYIPMIQKVLATSAFPIVFTDLRGPLQVKRNVFYGSLKIAFTICCVFYFTSSFAVSIGFGKYNKPSMLESFSPCHFIFMDVISVSFSVFLILSYPLLLQPATLVVLQWMHKSVRDYKYIIIINTLSVVFTTILAMFLDNIAAIFGLFTALTGFMMYFFMPLVAYYKLPDLKKACTVPTVRDQLAHPEIIDRGLSLIMPAVPDASSLLTGDTDPNAPKDKRPEMKEYDFSHEYLNPNMKSRKIWAFVWTLVLSVCSVVAFWLNLMDFFK